MSELIEIAKSAERILVPKGKDCSPALSAFTQATGVEVPDFKPRSYKAISQGRTFFSVSAKDVPRFVQKEYADVGVTGKDQYLETKSKNTDFPQMEVIGPSMCYLAVLACKDQAESVARNMYYAPGFSLVREPVMTSFPNIIELMGATSDLNFCVFDTCQGSTEIMPDIVGCRAVVDIVGKGRTATVNGLVVVEKLMDVPPVLVGWTGGKNESI